MVKPQDPELNGFSRQGPGVLTARGLDATLTDVTHPMEAWATPTGGSRTMKIGMKLLRSCLITKSRHSLKFVT